MLSGMATGIQEVVRRDVGSLLYYVPVVNPASSTSPSTWCDRLEEERCARNFVTGVFRYRLQTRTSLPVNVTVSSPLLFDVDPGAGTARPTAVQDRLAGGRGARRAGSVAERARRPFSPPRVRPCAGGQPPVGP